MRLVLAAAATAAAALAQSAHASPTPETLFARSQGTIAGFAQDGSQIAWFAPNDKNGCNVVHVLSLANGIKVDLPAEGANRNVTCLWPVTPPVQLALARDTSSVVWTLREMAPLRFDYLVGASAGDRRERRFQQLAHTSRGAGLWLGGVAGDGSSLVYGVTSVDYVDEAGCLAGTGSCAMTKTGGGVYRVVGRPQTPKLVPGTGPATAVAVSGGTLAYVPADTIAKGGRPVSGTNLPIEVVDLATGQEIATAEPQGAPVAVALSQNVLATLEQTPLGMRLAWYDPTTGTATGSVAVAPTIAPELALSDRFAVFHVGRSIRAVDFDTGRIRTLATAATDPIGLSLEGSRVAWAENPKGRGRIRALYVSGRG
jgi:hypothetical protein